ncbi:MAG TPA: hypothetical protein VHW06_01265 [Streptosporangiaceae bacterium]|nr:hypothetical protein [Streptosporangiaceae bacterium]
MVIQAAAGQRLVGRDPDRAVTVPPESVVIVQRPVPSSKVAAVTFVLNWMSGASPNRSVTCSR